MSAVLESRLLIRKDRDPAPQTESSSAGTIDAPQGITLRPQPISRGPLAAVYRGWDRVHHCHVIVKVQHATDDPVAMNRFQREAAVMLRLRHPSIVTLYSYHEGDPAALIMEYVPGRTLAAQVAADGPLSVARAGQIIEEVAAALDCVHAVGIVHRDIKPSNILLPRRGPAKLTDFGVAHIGDGAPLTVMGDMLGTIEYASPEQVHGNWAPDTRSDVYSLAAVAYFALTGTPPFQAADNSTQAQLSVMHRQVFSEPPPLHLHRADLTPALEEAVLRGLAKAPEARYASAGQFAAALRAAVIAASGKPQQNAIAASSRRTGAQAGALAAVLLLLGGFVLWKTGGLTPAASVASLPVPTPKAFKASGRKRLHVKRPHVSSALAARRLRAHIRRHVLAHSAVPPSPAVPFKKSRPLVYARHNITQPVLALGQATGSSPAAGVGWYAVTGWISVADHIPARKARSIHAPAQWIKVDGKPLHRLALGKWAELPVGKHLVTFQPSPGLGAGPKTWSIDLASKAHLHQQVPLSSSPLPSVPPHLRNP